MATVEGLGGRGQDRIGQALVWPQAIRKPHAVHVPGPLAVEGEDGGSRGSGKEGAHDDLDRQDVQAASDDDVRVRILQDMVRADVGGLLEPVACSLGEHLALVGNGRKDPVEGGEPVRGDEDPPAIGQIVVLADLTPVVPGEPGEIDLFENWSQWRAGHPISGSP